MADNEPIIFLRHGACWILEGVMYALCTNSTRDCF